MTSPHSRAQGWRCMDALFCPRDLRDLYITTKVSPPIFPAPRVQWYSTCQMTPHDPRPEKRTTLCACVCACVKIPRGGLVREQVIRYACACFHLCVCVCTCSYLFVCVHITGRTEKSWDGQLYHAYLKGHSIIVGLHFTEPPCSHRKANWFWRDPSTKGSKGLRLALKVCTSLEEISKVCIRKCKWKCISSR